VVWRVRWRFVSFFGVAINWLNGQRFSTFHFIRDNRLCAEGRMGELLLEDRRTRSKRQRCDAKRTLRTEIDSCIDRFLYEIDPAPRRRNRFPFLLFQHVRGLRFCWIRLFPRAGPRKMGGINGMLKRAWMFASPVFVWLHRARLARFFRKIQSEREKSAAIEIRWVIRQYVDAVVLYGCAGTHNRELIRVTIYILLRHEEISMD